MTSFVVLSLSVLSYKEVLTEEPQSQTYLKIFNKPPVNIRALNIDSSMKATYLVLSAAFAGSAYGACPFAELKRSGVLSEDDIAKFEAIKRDPKAAEALFKAHQAEKREPAPQSGIVSPILNGVLDLPLGGSLREYFLLPKSYARQLRLNK